MPNEGIGDLWSGVLEDVRGNFPEPAYETVLKNAKVRIEDGGRRVILRFPKPYMKQLLTPEDTRCLEEAFSRRLGEPIQLELLSDSEDDLKDVEGEPGISTGEALDQLRMARETLSSTEKASPTLERRKPDGIRLNPRYTFRQFVVGKHCQLAHAAAQAVAAQPGTVYNPLFIYALTGLGKTHLLQAIGHEVLKNRPESRVTCVTSEAFTNELIEGIQHPERMSSFRRKYRNVDVLLIDDIQFLIGKDRTQEAFFHIFNTLHELGRQVVITSDRPPAEHETLEERLISRFEWGLTVDMSKPDYETRLAILNQKNAARGFGLPADILGRIAHHVDSNVRELEGALTKVSAHQRFSKKSVALDEIDELLMHYGRPETFDRATSPEEIIDETAAHFQVSVDDLLGDRRTARITVPRQVAMHFCRELTHLSLKDIGGAFGGKDHTTVIYALNRVETRLGVDESFAREVMLLRERLKKRFRGSED